MTMATTVDAPRTRTASDDRVRGLVFVGAMVAVMWVVEVARRRRPQPRLQRHPPARRGHAARHRLRAVPARRLGPSDRQHGPVPHPRRDDRAQRPRPHRGGHRDRGARRRPRHVADRARQHEPHRRQRPRVRLRRLPDRARDLQPEALHLAAGVAVIAVYGATLLFSLVPHPGVSWQGHLFGAIGGVVAARVLDRRRRRWRHEVRPRQRLDARAHLPRGRGGEGRPRPHHRGHALGGDRRRRLDRAHRRPGLARGARGPPRGQAAHRQGPAGDPQEHRREDPGQLADHVPLDERRRRRGRGRADDGGRGAAREPAARDVRRPHPRDDPARAEPVGDQALPRADGRAEGPRRRRDRDRRAGGASRRGGRAGSAGRARACRSRGRRRWRPPPRCRRSRSRRCPSSPSG